MTNWRLDMAAISLAPQLYQSWLSAQGDESRPVWDDLPFAERDLWILLSETVLDAVGRLVTAFPGQVREVDEPFQSFVKLTRNFAAIKGGKVD